MCRRIVFAAFRMGASRLCVAQKYHRFQNFQPDVSPRGGQAGGLGVL